MIGCRSVLMVGASRITIADRSKLDVAERRLMHVVEMGSSTKIIIRFYSIRIDIDVTNADGVHLCRIIFPVDYIPNFLFI